MNITLPMLLTQMPEEYKKYESMVEGETGIIHSIRLSIPRTKREDDVLYVGKVGNYVRLMLADKTFNLDNDIRVEETFNLINEAFINLRDWDMNIHLAIIGNKGVQSIIDVSENILKNPITFLDPGFKLVAYSKNSKSIEPIYREIIEKGYMASETVKDLDVGGRLLDRNSGQKVFLQEESGNFQEKMLISRVDFGEVFLGTISLVLSETGYICGFEELFDHLRAQIILYLENSIDRDAYRRYAHSSLLADIIDEKLDYDIISERNRYANLPLEGNFCLIKLTRKENAPHSLYYYLESKLTEIIPLAKVFSLRKDVLILTNQRNDDTADRLRAEIVGNNLLCGISENFTQLKELPCAFEQASAAIRLGELLRENSTLKKLGIAKKLYASRQYYYKDYYPYHHFEKDGDTPELSSLPIVFTKLFEKDQKEETDNIRVLYTYLQNECNKTHTAEVLYMHRNNINYRIRRIEEILGTEIDKEPLKTSLRIAFLILELIDPDKLTKDIEKS